MALVANPWGGAAAALLKTLSPSLLPPSGGGAAPAASTPVGTLLAQLGAGMSPQQQQGITSQAEGAYGGVANAPGMAALVSGAMGGGTGAPAGYSYATADGPPAWFAHQALAAFNSGNAQQQAHLLAWAQSTGNPHLINFANGLFHGGAAEQQDRIREAHFYGDGWVQGGPNTGTANA